MTILITALHAEIQARCDALNNDSNIDEVIEVAIAAKKIAMAGGTLDQTTLAQHIQRIVDLSGGGSQIEDLIALAAAIEKPAEIPETLDPLPIGMLAPFVDQGIHFTDSNNREWLKSGYISTDIESYPDAVHSYLPGNSPTVNTMPTGVASLLFHESSQLWLCSANTKVYSSTDRINWVERASIIISNMIELPSGMVIGLKGAGNAYYYTNDGISWTEKSGQAITLINVVKTINGYWYGFNANITAWGKNDSAITTVTVATGSYWRAIAYSLQLNRLVMVGDSLCQTNDAAFAGAWVSRTIPNGSYSAVEWFPDIKMFIAVGTAANCATSPDGITWTAQPVLSAGLNYLYYDKFTRTLFGSNSGAAVIYTRNGVDWVSINAPSGTTGKMASKFSEGVLFAGGKFSPYIPVVGVEVASAHSSVAPHYVRIK